MFFNILILLLVPWGESVQPKDQVERLHQKAYNYLDEKYDSALLISQQALKISKELKYQWGIGNSYFIIGYIMDERDEVDSALTYYLQSEYELRSSDHPKAFGVRLDNYLNIGGILRRNYEYKAAIETYREALLLAETIRYPKKRLRLLFNLSYALQSRGNLPEAVDTLKKGIALATALNSTRILAKMRILLGVIHSDTGDYPTSRKYYQTVIKDTTVSKLYISQAYHNLAYSYIKEKDPFTAISYYFEAKDIKETLNSPKHLFRTYHGLAQAFLQIGDTNQSSYYAKRCEVIYPKVEQGPDNYQVFRLLDTLNYIKKKFELSQRYSSLYSRETLAFNTRQKQLIELKKSFRTGLLVSNFKYKVHNEEKERKLWTIIRNLGWASSAIITAIIVFFLYKRYKIRRDIQRELIKLNMMQ